MEDCEYDAVVCGTGLKECIISGLLSVHGKKVLHVDRNGYYGGDAASLNLTNLYEKFKPNEKPPESFGANRYWNVDLVPKFVMADGKLVKMLLKTRVTRYLQWKSVEGTYVYQFQKAGLLTGAKYIHKVPATEQEALSSPLMNIQEKFRVKNFYQFAHSFEVDKKESWKGFDPEKNTMGDIYKHFNLQPNSIDYLGHAVALYYTDDYIDKPMGPTMARVKLYLNSIMKYGQSPFLYPLFGLGGLPEGFSRLSAINGGVYMLNTPVDAFEFDANGAVCGVKSGNQVAKCKMVVCDPSYVVQCLPAKKKVKEIGRVIRCICILGAPIPCTNNVTSCQIIIPQKQIKRHHDVYIMMVSDSHQVAAAGKYIAIVSTTAETENAPETEIKDALELLGKIEEKFLYVSPVFERQESGDNDKIFVSNSYDALSHFETVSEDCIEMWKNIVGEELDLTHLPDPSEDEC
eukprot:Filipodium_phascolosomae@DN1921_c0_g1_i1.p1